MINRLGKKALCVTIGTAVVVSALYGVFHRWCGPGWDFGRLLAGDESIHIKSLLLRGQGKTIKLNDPEAMKYLTDSLRQASTQGGPDEFGHTYYAYLDLGYGAPIRAYFDAPDAADGLNVGYPAGLIDEPTHYWVPFRQAIPAEVARMLTEMRAGLLETRAVNKERLRRITQATKFARSSQTRSMTILGIGRTTLRTRMRELGLLEPI